MEPSTVGKRWAAGGFLGGAVGALLALAMAFALGCCLYWSSCMTYFPPLPVIAGGVAVACLILLLLRIPLKGVVPRSEAFAAALVFALFIAAQCYIATQLRVKIQLSWDFPLVANEASTWVETGAAGSSYFSYWPNNAPLFLLYCGLFGAARALGVSYTTAGIALNILAVDLSLLLVFLSARRIGGRRAGLVALGLGAATPALLLYTCIYYTDTLSMPFVAGSLYIWLTCRDLLGSKGIGACPWRLGLFCLTLAAGTLLKTSVAIVGMAAAVDLVISKPLRRSLPDLALCAALVALFITGGKALVSSSPALPEEDPECYIPKLHWVMMGLVGRGEYYDSDYKVTLSVPAEERLEQCKGIIADRLSIMGVSGLARHQAEKTGYIWGDGTYYASAKIDRDRESSSPLDRFANYLGEDFYGFGLACQWILAATELLMLLGGVRLMLRRDRLSDSLLVYGAAIIGIFLFLELWEARSRYLVNFIPAFAVFAVCSASSAGRREIEHE